MARGASSTGKGVRRAAPDRQARVGVQEWVWWGSARAGRRRDSGRSHTRPGGSCHAPPLCVATHAPYEGQKGAAGVRENPPLA